MNLVAAQPTSSLGPAIPVPPIGIQTRHHHGIMGQPILRSHKRRGPPLITAVQVAQILADIMAVLGDLRYIVGRQLATPFTGYSTPTLRAESAKQLSITTTLAHVASPVRGNATDRFADIRLNCQFNAEPCLYIDGRHRDLSTGRTMGSANPVTEVVLGLCTDASADDSPVILP